ncbi:MAG: lipoyl(octanoyl) transferase LipB [Deltaproteobacteria bacterium]
MDRELVVRHLGRVEYADGLTLMERFRAARQQGNAPDTLFLLEHPPVVTLGRGGKRAHLLAPEAALAARGIELFETERGGDVTYHGPGQVVGYPIVDLSPDRRDVRRYVHDLEEAMIRAAGELGVAAGRVDKLNGIWLGEDATPPTPGLPRKLGAVGVHLSRWISSHGFALNANTRLSDFDLIVPCGLSGRGVTSLERELGRPVALGPVEEALGRHLAALLDRRQRRAEAEAHFVQVQLVREGREGLELLALKRTTARGGFWQPITGHVALGEALEEAAARELAEEVGVCQKPKPLGYRHAFHWPSGSLPGVAEETAFAALVPTSASPRLDPEEHEAFRWVSLPVALELFPFAGLRHGARLAVGAGPA